MALTAQTRRDCRTAAYVALMSVVDHLGHIVHSQSVQCAECGQAMRRRDAFIVDGRAFCCVLHEVEYSLGQI